MLRGAPRWTGSWWALGAPLLLLCAAVSAGSFIIADPLRDDFERFHDLRVLFLFFALFVGLSAVHVAAYAWRPAFARRTVLLTAGACGVVLLASFPVGSRDVFGYAFLGRMWGTYRANPFVVAPARFAADPWYPFLAGTLRRPLSVYGPLFLLQAWLLNTFAGQSLWLAVALHKIAALLMFLAILWLADGIMRRTAGDQRSRAWLLLLLAWNPLFLFEAAGSAHNDIAMVLLVLAAVRCWSARRPACAVCALGLSFWYKYYSLIFLPAFLVESWKTGGPRAALRQGAAYVLATLVCGLVLLAPWRGALTAIVGELLNPQKLHGIYPNELSPVLAAWFWALRATGRFATGQGWRLFDAGRYALLAVAGAAIVVRQWRTPPSLGALIESSCLTGLACFFLLITQLWPWHLLTVVALATIGARSPFVLLAVVLSVLALLSNFLTFAVATLLLLLVGGALWLLRRLPAATLTRGAAGSP